MISGHRFAHVDFARAKNTAMKFPRIGAAGVLLLGIGLGGLVIGAQPGAEPALLDAGREQFTKIRLQSGTLRTAPGNPCIDVRLGFDFTPAGEGPTRMFNARSCSECHRQGGIGGGGANEHNVQMIAVGAVSFPALEINPWFNGESEAAYECWRNSFFPRARNGSMILHRFGTSRGYAAWRCERLSAVHLHSFESVGPQPTIGPRFAVAVPLQELNTPALFGSGLIDAIEQSVIDAGAASQPAEVRGRSPVLDDGRIGRFGWKCQTATLAEFNENACAVELGLATPRHAPATVRVGTPKWPSTTYFQLVEQSSQLERLRPYPDSPEGNSQLNGERGEIRRKLFAQLRTELEAAGQKVVPHQTFFRGTNVAAFTAKAETASDSPEPDMTEADLAALTAFVAALPAPKQFIGPSQRADVAAGRQLFESVRCNECHTPTLGGVDLYSDLLLHSIGTLNSGTYGIGFSPADLTKSRAKPAQPGEFRTPPLWGVADSSPYLHDGSAATLEEAVVRHGHQAGPSRDLYLKLPPEERRRMITFLESLRAPE
jgi:mono/diheme cytochrome c family protein